MNLDHLKSAWKSIPTSVGVLIVNDIENFTGITINSFFSVSLDYSILAVSLSNNSNTMKYIDKTKIFSISILNTSQRNYANFFSKKNKLNIPNNLIFNTSKNGVKSIKDASVIFYCKLSSSNKVEDHTILYCKIYDVELNHNDPLIWKF